jgi:hypothetical protein
MLLSRQQSTISSEGLLVMWITQVFCLYVAEHAAVSRTVGLLRASSVSVRGAIYKATYSSKFFFKED